MTEKIFYGAVLLFMGNPACAIFVSTKFAFNKYVFVIQRVINYLYGIIYIVGKNVFSVDLFIPRPENLEYAALAAPIIQLAVDIMLLIFCVIKRRNINWEKGFKGPDKVFFWGLVYIPLLCYTVMLFLI
ncbi:MAG: hypothetical protein AAFY98_03475 [Verrucomicrobiota bacterium]